MRYPRNPKKVCSLIGLALTGLFVAYIAGSVILTILMQSLFPAFARTELGVWVANDLALYGLGLPTFLLICLAIPNGPKRSDALPKLELERYLLLMLFCLGMMYGLNIAASWINDLLQEILDIFRTKAPPGSGGISGAGSPLATFVFFVCIPAIGEEFIFRHLLYRKLQGASDLTFILLSAFSFALLHGNLHQVLYTFPCGAAFAYAYLKTQNLLAPMGLHFFSNLMGGMVFPYLIQLTEYSYINTLLIVCILVLVIAAIIVFAFQAPGIKRELRPPAEAGWPWREPRPQATSFFYAPYGQSPPLPWPHGPVQAFGEQGFLPGAVPGGPYTSPPGSFYPAPPPGNAPGGPYAPPPGSFYPAPPPGNAPGPYYGPGSYPNAHSGPAYTPPAPAPYSASPQPPGPPQPFYAPPVFVPQARRQFGMPARACLLNAGMLLYMAFSLLSVLLNLWMG